MASGANVVLVHPSVPANSIQELIALAKKDPGKLNFASTGSGSSVHLAAELFASMAGVKINHVPYRGSGPALNDLLGGHVTMMFATVPSAVGIVKGGKVRALAVSSAKRSVAFPELPTIAEAGLTGYVAELGSSRTIRPTGMRPSSEPSISWRACSTSAGVARAILYVSWPATSNVATGISSALPGPSSLHAVAPTRSTAIGRIARRMVGW